MSRRPTKNITSIRGTGTVDYTVVWRVFQCKNPKCDFILKISEDDLGIQSNINKLLKCPICGTVNSSVVEEAPRWKYCRVCERLQPLENFHRHKFTSSSFRSGRQLECKECKNKEINPYLNPLRTADQHRESSEHRRLYGFLSGEDKVNSKKIYKKFNGECFKCGRELPFEEKNPKEMRLDHTLPASLLWPLQCGPTLLCSDCNNKKHGLWPSEFYEEVELRRLSVLTGILYKLLAGEPRFNPRAVKWLVKNIDEFLARWIKYPDEIKKIRKMIIKFESIDIFVKARSVPAFLRSK